MTEPMTVDDLIASCRVEAKHPSYVPNGDGSYKGLRCGHCGCTAFLVDDAPECLACMALIELADRFGETLVMVLDQLAELAPKLPPTARRNLHNTLEFTGLANSKLLLATDGPL